MLTWKRVNAARHHPSVPSRLRRSIRRHPRILRPLGRADLLILDDWGLEPLDAAARHDLLEILEERYSRRSTVITSQLPVDRWHEIIGDPTYADAKSNSPAKACAGPEESRTKRLDQTSSSMRKNQSASEARDPGGIIPLYPGGFVGIRTVKAEKKRGGCAWPRNRG